MRFLIIAGGMPFGRKCRSTCGGQRSVLLSKTNKHLVRDVTVRLEGRKEVEFAYSEGLKWVQMARRAQPTIEGAMARNWIWVRLWFARLDTETTASSHFIVCPSFSRSSTKLVAAFQSGSCPMTLRADEMTVVSNISIAGIVDINWSAWRNELHVGIKQSSASLPRFCFRIGVCISGKLGERARRV